MMKIQSFIFLLLISLNSVRAINVELEKITFYHDIRNEIFHSLMNYFDRTVDVEHSVDKLNTFLQTYIKKKDGTDFKNNDPSENTENPDDYDNLDLDLKIGDLQIVEIKIFPELEDPESQNAESQDAESTVEKPQKKKEIKITMNNGIIESTIKLCYANHINKAIRRFIDSNVWNFMEKTRQIIFKLDEVDKDVEILLRYIFEKQNDEEFGKIEDNEKLKNLQDETNLEGLTEDNLELKKGDFQDSLEKLKKIKFIVHKKIIDENNKDEFKHFHHTIEERFKERETAFVYVLTPQQEIMEPFEIYLVKLKEDEKSKIKVLIESSYFSFTYEFNILTKRFLIKNLERIFHKLKEEVLAYLTGLEVMQEQTFDKPAVAKLQEEFKDKKIDIGAEIVKEDDNNPTEILKITIKKIDETVQNGDNSSESKHELIKYFPANSQYNIELFISSFIKLNEDINFYITPAVTKQHQEGENDNDIHTNFIKDMALPFNEINEVIVYKAHNLYQLTEKLPKKVNYNYKLELIKINDSNYTLDYKFIEGDEKTDISFEGYQKVDGGNSKPNTLPIEQDKQDKQDELLKLL